MKKSMNFMMLIAVSLLLSTGANAQKGVWVPAGGNIEGFNIATCVYENNLYVSGVDYKSPIPKSYIKKFNGVFWTNLVELEGYNNSISAMTEYKGDLYVAGSFMNFAGASASNGIVKWNGKTWSTVGGGFDEASWAQVSVLKVFNNKLYVGGRFDSIAGIQLNNLAVWDGANWSAGPLFTSSSGSYNMVHALHVFNNHLYIGGAFDKANSVNCSNIARYDGTNLFALNNGNGNGTNGEVTDFETYNGNLYLTGYFSLLDTFQVNGIALWNGTVLSKLTNESTENIVSLKAFNNVLFAAGAGWNSGIEFFNGTSWDIAGQSKLVAEGTALEVYKDRLYVFGGFISSDSSNFVFTGSAVLIDSGDACLAEGVVFLDQDKSCTQNNGELGFAKRMIEIQPVGVRLYTDSIGYFSIYLEKGTYSAKLLPLNYYASSCSDSVNFSFPKLGAKTDTLFFGTYVKDTVFDAQVRITSGNARPGFAMSYFVTLYNKGTASQNATLKVVLDNAFNYSTVKGPSYTRYNGNTMEWDFSPFMQNELIKIEVVGSIKSNTVLGTRMLTFAQVVPAITDAFMANNSDTAFNFVRGSFDPNDKQVYPPGSGANGLLGPNADQSLRYHIRFQNTGTDTAFNIVIIDTLSADLDMTTLIEDGASHPYTVELLAGNVLKFTFENILLADSNANESASHGFVSFNIKPKSGLALGTQIKNFADIYFDFNEPVRTNTTLSTFDNYGSVEKVTAFAKNQLLIYPNPGDGRATLVFNNAGQNHVIITDVNGRQIENRYVTANQYQLNLNDYIKGMYIIRVTDAQGLTIIGKYIKAF